jgi:hypothetical protein
MLRAETRSWRTGGPAAGADRAAAGASARRESARARAGAELATASSSAVGAAADTAIPTRDSSPGPNAIDPE